MGTRLYGDIHGKCCTTGEGSTLYVIIWERFFRRWCIGGIVRFCSDFLETAFPEGEFVRETVHQDEGLEGGGEVVVVLEERLDLPGEGGLGDVREFLEITGELCRRLKCLPVEK